MITCCSSTECFRAFFVWVTNHFSCLSCDSCARRACYSFILVKPKFKGVERCVSFFSLTLFSRLCFNRRINVWTCGYPIAMNLLGTFSDIFWHESVWLPPNLTWAKLEPKYEYQFTDYRHVYLYPIPLAFVILFLRYLTEK